MNTTAIKDKVEEVLDTLRPFLKADGGDVELVDIEDQTVRLRLLGACSSCSMSNMTMKAGIEEGIKKAIPEIQQVVAVD
ncbi:MAG: NifU family protein [Bacteroidota bacterium]|nr:NifU family protein [Bacteroidota bacterium]MDX5431717.1 NifU family protein [Bacteroidota bacterium]MDX5470432.1 NifU family protein [Bacteroidota bacterium]